MYAVKQPNSRKKLRPTTIRCATGLLVLCALSACKKDPETATGPATPGAPAAVQAVPPQQAVSAQVQAMSVEQLREAAGKALNEQRLYAPAGNNAMEYYLALRDKQPDDPAVSSALTDLQPYALIATEQSIARDDFVEAQRLYALMDKADPKAPALPRLKTSIATAQQAFAQRAVDLVAQTEEEAKRQAALEKERLAQQQAAQQQAAEQLAAQQRAAAAPVTPPPTQQPATQPSAPSPRPVATQPANPPPTPAAPPPAAASSNALRPISTPSPRYPAAAARAGQSGSVQVEFTVGTDGSVSSARVVDANPPRVFDRDALAAVKKWRFEPVASPVTTRRTMDFRPGN